MRVALYPNPNPNPSSNPSSDPSSDPSSSPNQVRVVLGGAVRKQEIRVTVRPRLLSVEVAGRGVVP